MAAFAKSGTPSYSSITPPQSATIVGLLAGEDIGENDACYIKTSDNKVWKASGAAANEAADVAGFSFTSAYTDDPVTLVDTGNIRYGAAQTPHVKLYLSGTVPGGLDTVASTGGTKAIAVTIDATRIRILTAGLWQGV